MPVQAAILAGGKGTRMRSVSDTPKVLLPLGDKPILVHQLEWLHAAGFASVHLCLGYQAKQVEDALGDGSRFGIDIHYQVEDQPRGTAGAVKDLGAAAGDDLLVVYGDLYVGLDCAKLLDYHASHDGIATLVVRKTDHPEDSDLAVVDPSGQITAIGRMEPDGIVSEIGCAAIWVVRRQLIDRIPTTGMLDFARDVFPEAVRAGEKVMAYETTDRVKDVGTPARYAAFNEALKQASLKSAKDD
jgi:NDP-sugar pyrophosphorylase family protein